ncbi:hypothetical protein FSP39_003064 [Pinctada imbricata]|uniref:G-protein coupled receptors family 1 profile domain-containing protein n=1 Tax=Pinctada imbricata TaxID=66713 RepID=A0AA88XHF8_PINIB|nr:hypothetical protein FSP39_003064 [Pinctada imbricata]
MDFKEMILLIDKILKKSAEQGNNITRQDLFSMNYTVLFSLLNPYLENIRETTSLSPLRKFEISYNKIHGYASLVTIIFGVLTNIIVITVLKQKKMRTPVNIILQSLAVFDTLTMVAYVPFAIKFYVIYSPGVVSPEAWTLPWAHAAAFITSFTATTHTISIWLVVNLSIFRFVHIRKMVASSTTRSQKICLAKKLIFCTTCISILVMIPHYLNHEIKATEIETINVTFYSLKEFELVSADTKPLVLVNFLLYAVVGKIIPCILIVIFGGLLLYHVAIKARARRRKFYLSNNTINNRSSRMTVILLVVMVIFILIECPQGVLLIMSLFVPQFYNNVYVSLGDVMDMAALLNNSFNFTLYCSMSAQFRQTFLRMYVHRVLKLCKRPSN